MPTYSISVHISLADKSLKSSTFSFEGSESDSNQIAEEAIRVAISELLARQGWEPYLQALPVPQGLYEETVTFAGTDFFNGNYEDRLNPNEVWLEIETTLQQARILLVHARSLKEIETHTDNFNSKMNLHLDKMERFNLAVYMLAKVEDLVCRLLFERFGASLVQLDLTDTDWEKGLIWSKIKKGLKNRYSITLLSSLDDVRYQALLQAFAGFKNPHFVAAFVRYRDAVTHRITPSVDYANMYSEPESREWTITTDSQGNLVNATKQIGRRSTRPDYEFVEIYELAQSTYQHFVRQLQTLKEAIS